MNTLLLAGLLLQTVAPGGIRGVVLGHKNGGDVVPLEGARVELTGGLGGSVALRTDAQGEFVFSNVPAGRYGLSVKNDAYVRQEYGQRHPGGPGATISVESGKELRGLTFDLKPAATIAGTVRNEYGEPVANILIEALRRTYGIRGNPMTTVFASTLTDDRGDYRLYWLDPGKYYVRASYLPKIPTPVNASDGLPRVAYAPTFYPGSVDAAGAQAFLLESGHDVEGANFHLTRATPVKVRGIAYDVLTRSRVPATVTLMLPEEAGVSVRYSAETDEYEAFELKSVNPGTYILAAAATSNPDNIGFTAIRVADADYNRAEVAVGPGQSVELRFSAEGGAAIDSRLIETTLVPFESHLPTPAPVRVAPTSVLTGVQPGGYFLRVTGLPQNVYVKTAMASERDVLAEGLQVSYGTTPPIDVRLAVDGGQITGVVSNSAGEPVARSTAVLVPEAGGRSRLDLYRVVVSEENGSFVIRGITPGNYKLFAWDVVEPNAYLNQAFMSEFEDLGIALEIGSNEEIAVRIRSIPAR